MPRRVTYILRWSSQEQAYELVTNGEVSLHAISAENRDWHTWLNDIHSFAFYSQAGTHCTVRKETIQNSGAYWYGYRFLHKRTMKRYIGRTQDLSLARLEEVAANIARGPQGKVEALVGPFPEPGGSDATDRLTFSRGPEGPFQLPRLPSNLIERPQLLSRLDDCYAYPLTLLSAPTGFGKTTLVNAWLVRRPPLPHAAWISLELTDNDPSHFWRSVMTACQVTPAPELPFFTPFLAISQLPLTAFSPEDSLRTFLHTIEQAQEPYLLVLEDYHVITEPAIHKLFSFFLNHLPPNLHIILMTRIDPPLTTLARLRANGELNEIQAADLRFSLQESLVFLQQTASLQPDAEMLEALDTHMEGWPAGLRLLSLVLQGATNQEQLQHILSTFRGSHRSARDYFVDEVLQTQPAALQDFLLRTSILSRLSAPLCEAVTGRADSGPLLELCERSNLFLESLDSSGEWYRYHTLFVEAMQYEARQRLGKEMLNGLSLKASHWFAEHGMLSDAIKAAIKGEANEYAVFLLEHYVQTAWLPNLHDLHMLRRWLEQLPETTLLQSSHLCQFYALALTFTNDDKKPDPGLLARIDMLLTRAEDHWRSHENLVGLGEVMAFQAFTAYPQGRREEALAFARQALAWLPETEPLWRSMGYGVLGIDALQAGQSREVLTCFRKIKAYWQHSNNLQVLHGVTFWLGMACFDLGELQQAAWHFRELLNLNNQGETSPTTLAAYLGLALTAYEWNDLDQLIDCLETIRVYSKQFTEFSAELWDMPLELGKAIYQHGQGETDQAIQRLSKLAIELRKNWEGLAIHLYPQTIYWLIRLSLLNGDLATANHWLSERPMPANAQIYPQSEEHLSRASENTAKSEMALVEKQPSAGISLGEAPRAFQEQQLLLQARLHLAQHEEDAALAILLPLLAEALAAERGRTVLQARLLLAQAHAVRKQMSEAHQYLLEGLKQAYVENYQRSFLDEGKNMFLLLQNVLPHLRSQSLRSYVQGLLRAFTFPSNQRIAPATERLFEPLSTQEQRVLRLLAAGLSNAEIAERLVVSVNTIRTQVQSIYRKLGVNNRHAASECARQLDLV